MKRCCIFLLFVLLISCSTEQLQEVDRVRQTSMAEAEVVVKTGEDISQTAISGGTSALQTVEALQESMQGFQSPVRGNFTIGGYRPELGDHTGRDRYAVDFMPSDNMTIYPTLSGKVVFSGWNCDTVSGNPPCYGNVVVVAHDNGMYSIYAHLADNGLPQMGIDVTSNDKIGTMSDSGCEECGIHLHFAVRSGRLGLEGRDALWLSNEPVNIWAEIAGLRECFPKKEICSVIIQ